jgi:hypothetical protein
MMLNVRAQGCRGGELGYDLNSLSNMRSHEDPLHIWLCMYYVYIHNQMNVCVYIYIYIYTLNILQIGN